MTLSTIESSIALSQRLKAARRIDLATASILRTCGVKVAVSRTPGPSMTRNNVYRVEGHDGDIIGVDALRAWLYERGVVVGPSTLAKALKAGKPIGAYKVTLVGTVARKNKPLKFQNPEQN